MQMPSQIWICAPGREPADWIVERMTTAEVAADGSFEIEASDETVTVKPGDAVFMFNEHIYACAPKLVQEKLAEVAGEDNEVVVELAEKTDAMREQKLASKAAAREEPKAKAAGDRPLKLKPMVGSPPAPQFALVDLLQVDDTYQRSIEGGASQKLIVRIAENWDWRLCLPLIVSRRQNQLFVIDGQHRLEAARLRGDIRDVPVVVFDFDDPKAEAELFVQANRSRRAMSKLDDFHAAIVAGEPKALAVNEVVKAAGLTVGRIQAWQYWKPGEVVFVTAIQRALHFHGKAVAQQALDTVAQAFDGLVLTGVGAIFSALTTMIHEGEKGGNPVDLELMGVVLSETGIPGWKEAVENVNDGVERTDLMLAALRAAYAEAGAE